MCRRGYVLGSRRGGMSWGHVVGACRGGMSWGMSWGHVRLCRDTPGVDAKFEFLH